MLPWPTEDQEESKQTVILPVLMYGSESWNLIRNMAGVENETTQQHAW